MSQASDLNFLAPYIRETNFSTNAQLSHRIHIIKNIWAIPPGSKVLEIGCGQGDCTLVLAAAVGESGRVDAVDPASLDYGIYALEISPITIYSNPRPMTKSLPQALPRLSAKPKPPSKRARSGLASTSHRQIPWTTCNRRQTSTTIT